MHVRCNHPGTMDIFGKWGYEYSAPLLLPLTSELKCLYRAHSHFSHLSVLTWLMIQSNRDDMGFRYSVCGLAEYLWFSSSRYVRFFSFPTRLHLHERMAPGQSCCRTGVRSPGSWLDSAMNLLCDFRQVMISLDQLPPLWKERVGRDNI